MRRRPIGVVTFFRGRPSPGKRIAVVAPARRASCAHELRRFGPRKYRLRGAGPPRRPDVHGVAAYKVSTDFCLAENRWICSIADRPRTRQPILPRRPPGHAEESTPSARHRVGRTMSLGIRRRDMAGRMGTLDFIAQTASTVRECESGREVVVIGPGTRRSTWTTAREALGAIGSTIAYRRARQ